LSKHSSTAATDPNRREVEITRLNRLLATLSAVNKTGVRATERQQLLDEICHISVEKGGFRLAAIRLVEAEGPNLRIVAHHGHDGGYLEWSTRKTNADGNGGGPSGIAVHTGKHWVTADIATAAEMVPWREEALKRGFRSLGAFPLRVEGEVVGCLTLYSETVGFTHEDELRLLDEMAGDVSFALENIEREKQRRQLEADLRSSLERYRGLYESLPGGVMVVDLTLTIIDTNPVAREILGVQVADVAGRNTMDPVWDAIHEDGTPFPGDTHPASVTLRTGERVRGVVMGLFSHSAGQTRWILVNSEPLRDPQTGDVQVALVHFVDITESRLAEQKVAAQTRMLDTILTASPVGISLARSGVLLWTNAALDRMLGHEPGALVGQSSRLLFKDTAEWDRVSQELESGGVGSRTAEADGLVLRGDDTKVYGHLVARLVAPEDPSQGYIVVLTDMTERRRAEEAYRLATVGQLAAGVAHDFNNLLASMSLTADLVELGRADCQQLMEIVQRSTSNGAEITKNLLAFARPDQPRREAGRLETSLDAALAVAARQLANAEISVFRQYASAPRPVVFDAAQMERVFLNLIINACHAMPQSGTLTIRTEYPSPSSEAGEAVIQITDTGTGIAPEHLSRIFDPFFTTKVTSGESETSGSGLGLSVSHGLVTAHGGTIAVSGEVGSGTTFEIRLPLSADATFVEAAGHDAATTPENVAELKGVRVLVAEDESDMLALMRQLLDSIGCEVVTAATADEAIEVLRLRKFDLVLSDLMMPGGGGRAVVEFSRTMGENAPPVIIVTGHLERALHDEVMALGAAGSMEKPFKLNDLLRLLLNVVRSRGR
jgi:hypothetical protein